MIKECIAKLVDGTDLFTEEAIAVMGEIMDGQATPAQISAFLVALRVKGETVDEITGCARVMRERATHVDPGEGIVVDTCGTGGDVKGTFNISTAAALVVAGAGVKVAKHGNRSFTGKTGSADLLEGLGVKIDVDVPVVERCLREAGIGFLFAPRLHGAMKHAVGPRKEIGIRTVFNILGPLSNPAGAGRQVIGVYDGDLTAPMANVLKNLGSTHCFVVHGDDGLDEVSTCAPTRVSELVNGEVRSYSVRPEEMGLSRAELSDFVVDSVDASCTIVADVLGGEKGAQRDIVLANAAFVLRAAGAAADLRSAVDRAADAVDSGRARRALEKLIKISHSK
ncbi:MAG: anthranilate phosphoribosyltransferase [Planctomycetes bacterium]|nr:anthranilate phosphoribosyltransferase [Planctomycetota bacterium]